MSIIGKVESLWRYPVKSMRGEELDEAFAVILEFMAIASSPSEVRRVTRDFRILQHANSATTSAYRPHFRYPEKAARPINLSEAESKNANPLLADLAELSCRCRDS